MTVDVVVVGSANLDLVATTERLPGPGETVLGHAYAEHAGGKGLNQAVAAARAGASVAMIAALGADDAGRRLRDLAVAEGIDVDEITIEPHPTGRAVITVDRHAENTIVVVPGANAVLTPPASLPPCRTLLCQLEVPLEVVDTVLQVARGQGVTTILNPAPARPLDPVLLAHCDVVVPNEHELELLGGLDALLAGGVGAVVVTLGSAGVLVADASGRRTRVEPFEVDPVDTTGAGDAFCGYLAARLAAGDPLTDAVRIAAAAGALATTTAGAVPSLPRFDAVRRLGRPFSGG